MALGKTIDDAVIWEIYKKDMRELGFRTGPISKLTGKYLVLKNGEVKKAIARGGYKPGQIVHRDFISGFKATGFEDFDFDDSLDVPYRGLNSRKDADTSVELTPGIVLHLPLVSANMESVTGLDMVVAMAQMGGLGILHQFMSLEKQIEIVRKIKELKVVPGVVDNLAYVPAVDSKGRYLVGAAKGINGYSVGQARALQEAGLDILCLDVAQGHSDNLARAVYETKQELPLLPIIAGNVATAKATYELFFAGADAPKVGVAQSIACATEPNTGAGLPQPHAIYRCSVIAREFGKKIIGDSGFNTGGKVVKGLAFGAGAIMTGQMLAATDSANDFEERVTKRDSKGNPLKLLYYGSASDISKRKHGRPSYDPSEGNAVEIPYAGSTQLVLSHLDMWIRSGMSYAGRSTKNGSQSNIQRMQEHSRWILK